MPPPAILEDRIREVMEMERDYMEQINNKEAVEYDPTNTKHVSKVHGVSKAKTWS